MADLDLLPFHLRFVCEHRAGYQRASRARRASDWIVALPNPSPVLLLGAYQLAGSSQRTNKQTNSPRSNGQFIRLVSNLCRRAMASMLNNIILAEG